MCLVVWKVWCIVRDCGFRGEIKCVLWSGKCGVLCVTVWFQREDKMCLVVWKMWHIVRDCVVSEGG
jgi:hypothetical protein